MAQWARSFRAARWSFAAGQARCSLRCRRRSLTRRGCRFRRARGGGVSCGREQLSQRTDRAARGSARESACLRDRGQVGQWLLALARFLQHAEAVQRDRGRPELSVGAERNAARRGNPGALLRAPGFRVPPGGGQKPAAAGPPQPAAANETAGARCSHPAPAVSFLLPAPLSGEREAAAYRPT